MRHVWLKVWAASPWCQRYPPLLQLHLGLPSEMQRPMWTCRSRWRQSWRRMHGSVGMRSWVAPCHCQRGMHLLLTMLLFLRMFLLLVEQ